MSVQREMTRDETLAWKVREQDVEDVDKSGNVGGVGDEVRTQDEVEVKPRQRVVRFSPVKRDHSDLTSGLGHQLLILQPRTYSHRQRV